MPAKRRMLMKAYTLLKQPPRYINCCFCTFKHSHSFYYTSSHFSTPKITSLPLHKRPVMMLVISQHHVTTLLRAEQTWKTLRPWQKYIFTSSMPIVTVSSSFISYSRFQKGIPCTSKPPPTKLPAPCSTFSSNSWDSPSGPEVNLRAGPSKHLSKALPVVTWSRSAKKRWIPEKAKRNLKCPKGYWPVDTGSSDSERKLLDAQDRIYTKKIFILTLNLSL